MFSILHLQEVCKEHPPAILHSLQCLHRVGGDHKRQRDHGEGFERPSSRFGSAARCGGQVFVKYASAPTTQRERKNYTTFFDFFQSLIKKKIVEHYYYVICFIVLFIVICIPPSWSIIMLLATATKFKCCYCTIIGLAIYHSSICIIVCLRPLSYFNGYKCR